MPPTNSKGFRPEYFSNLAAMETGNFWFIARNELILWALDKYCSDFSSLLEIGCGTGYVMSGIEKRFPKSYLTGSELYPEGLEFAKSRVPAARFEQLDARRLPYQLEFDVLGAFDVLEHIDEDQTVLSGAHSALKDNGHIVLTVPQHKWLWSPTDEYACHQRRYSSRELHDKLATAGFRIVRSTSFVSTLLPAVFVSRFTQRSKSVDEIDPTSEFKLPKIVNKLFLSLLRLEIRLIRAGINFPIGSSRLVIAQKVSTNCRTGTSI